MRCVCAMGFVLFVWATVASAAPAAPRVELGGHVLAALESAQRVDTGLTRVKAVEPIALTLILRRTDQAGFDRYLADLYDQRSPQFKRYLTPTEVSDRFGPGADDYRLVREHFVAHGLVPLEDSPNRLTLRVLGTRAQIEQVLALELRDYTLKGTAFRANDREPSLPRAVAARVQAVVGLSDYALPAHLNTTFQSLDRCIRNAQGIYTPDLQLACALIYGVDAALYDLACAFAVVAIQLQFSLTGLGAAAAGGVINKVSGCHFVYPGGPVVAAAARGGKATQGPPPPLPATGQIVGIVAFDTFQLSDVGDFNELVGSPPGQLSRISEVQISGGATPGPDQDEVLLDIGQVIALAPGANVVVYDIPFALGSFQALFNRMLTDGVDVVSNSWTYCEAQTTAADAASIDSVLASLAASGITVLNASGDSGTTCLNAFANSNGVPSGSPNATAVGGSSYTWGPAPLYTGTERWWDGVATNPPTGQGGFGVSRFYARPAYQNGFTGSAFRSVPDVVAAADPINNGKPICQAAKGGCPSGLFYGGTSVAAPLWAAIIADLNAGLPQNIGFLNPQLYPLANTGALHGATELASDFAHVGLGSPNAAQLYFGLSNMQPGVPTFDRTDVAAVPSEVAADGLSVGTVVVQLRDFKGLPVRGKTVTLSANAGSQAQIAPASAVSSVANGAVQFAVTDTTLETVTLTAFDVTDNVGLKSTTITFVSPPATAGSINGFPTSVPANGASTTTIVVTLQDAQAMPVSGKLVTLSVGGAHAIVTGPSPSVTNAMGQIQFTATNRTAETVTFTAVDVTDGELPVPGAAIVEFTTPATATCAVAPVAAPGYTVAAFATGFFAEPFFFGGVNWGGCPGASNPTFEPGGKVLITNFRTGDVFKLEANGGAATASLSNAGQTIGQPTFAQDGRLYATHGSTGGGFGTGNVVELNPATGAIVRVVAPNLTCPNGLAVDPLGGDLFFDGSCFGAGTDRPQVFRITDPSETDPGRPTEVVTYATMPTTPNGQMAFSPDGTLYLSVGYNTVRQVWRVAGTNQPQPAAIAQVAGLTTLFWLNVAAVDPDGSARSLILLNPTSPFPLELADLSTGPPTITTLLTVGASSGTIGPDGCLYVNASDSVAKVAPANGACAFSATNPTPALALSPPAVQPNPTQGTVLSFAAQLHNASPTPGQYARFQVTGSNLALKVVPFNASGKATFNYTGSVLGTDTVYAHTVFNGNTMLSNPARVTWSAGPHATALNLSTSSSGGLDGTPAQFRAVLSDLSTTVPGPIAGAEVVFTLSTATCMATTNANGVAVCGAIIPPPGNYTLSVTFAGGPGLLPSSASRAFFSTPFNATEGVFRDGFEDP